MAIPVFIDGAAGTTGLLIEGLLREHPGFEVLSVPGEHRKDPAAKRAVLAEAECAILCLPDGAALDAAVLADELGVRVLDASSAHRVDDRWTYGLPELRDGSQRKAIAESWRVANPGCYATGALLALEPLVRAGLVDAAAHIPVVGVSGYSGGGRSMLDRFGPGGGAVRYGTYTHGREHKHVREITRYAGLDRRPQFVPSVGNFERGMAVLLPLAREALTGHGPEQVVDVWAAAYREEPYVQVRAEQPPDEHGLLMIDGVVGTNTAVLHCFASGEDVSLVCHLDNLGKGASYAAVQNLNIMFGFAEGTGIDGERSVA